MTLTEMKTLIIQLNLDIIIFGEIGMDIDTYFLAFNRLEKKSIVFWGHAITSGIMYYSNLEQAIVEKQHYSTLQNQTSQLISTFDRGGPDYFVSSVLFESKLITGQHQQQKYTERLILQEVCYFLIFFLDLLFFLIYWNRE